MAVAEPAQLAQPLEIAEREDAGDSRAVMRQLAAQRTSRVQTIRLFDHGLLAFCCSRLAAMAAAFCRSCLAAATAAF